jgi:hypothetical protein
MTITEIGTAGTATAGWAYTQVANLSSGADGVVTGGTDTAYYFDLLSATDDAEYCAIINNMVDGTTSLDVNSSTAFISTSFNSTAYPSMYCVGTTAGTGTGPFRIFFVK